MKNTRLHSRSSVYASFAPAALAAIVAWAPAARAEDVVTTSGARYDARDLVWTDGDATTDGRLKFTYAVGGGSVTLELPMSRIDAWSLLALKSARMSTKDGKASIALAKFALAHGLPTEAERRFRRAVVLDPSLTAERDAGLRAIQDFAGAKLLVQAEIDLKRGRSDLAFATANDVAAKADPAGTLVGRATTLAALASRMLDTDRARRAAQAKAQAEAADVAREASLVSGIARADKAVNGAIAERTKAGDPGLSVVEATRSLESADAQLREGRRVLASVRSSAGVRIAEVDGRDKEARAMLVATDLDLAEIHRQQRRFDRARDFLRAAQILDPDNVRVKEIRDLIERDLATPPLQERPPYDPFVSSVVYGGTYHGSSYYGGYGGYGGSYARPRAYVTPRFPYGGGFGAGYGSGHRSYFGGGYSPGWNWGSGGLVFRFH